MRKKHLYEEAVILRKAGYSYNYIKEKVRVSKSTLSVWLSNIPYVRNQQTMDKITKARFLANEAQRAKKMRSLERAKKIAIEDIGKFTKRDLFMLGLGVYIGEGTKTGNSVRVVNSDSKIIKTIIFWFKNVFDLQNINFSIRIHAYPDSDLKCISGYWSRMTGLSKSSFLKTHIDIRLNKKRKNYGKLPYGTAHLTVKSAGKGNAGVFLLRRILSQIDLVHKKAGVV